MSIKPRLFTPLVAVAAAAIPLCTASADVLVENFDYGDNGGRLNSFGSDGDGWAGGWSGSNNGQYEPSPNLTYTAPGYNNHDNTSDTGAAGGGSGWTVNPTYRELATPITEGTIWISYLQVSRSSGDDGRLAFRLNGISSDDTDWDRINVNNNNSVEVVLDGSSSPTEVTLGNMETHLFLLKQTVDANEVGNDTFDLWINPDLSGGESGLGTADHSATGVDLLNGHGSFKYIGIQPDGRKAYDDHIDATRISSAQDGFVWVTAIPEPASLALLGLGGLLMLGRGKRRVQQV